MCAIEIVVWLLGEIIVFFAVFTFISLNSVEPVWYLISRVRQNRVYPKPIISYLNIIHLASKTDSLRELIFMHR